MRSSLVAIAASSWPKALLASATPALGLAARGYLASAPAAAVEKGPFQTGSAEGAQKPFVEEEGLASKREIRDSYRDVMKERSGTAEDVSVKDQAQSTLGSMMRDPRYVEREYAAKAREAVVSHGGRERESEDEAVADAVFDQGRSDSGYDESTNAGQPWDSTYATKPK